MERISLMYHCVYNDSASESGFQNDTAKMYKVRRDIFEEQVKIVSDYLRDNNLPKDTVEFTFDDGGISFYSVIAPILEKYGIRGSFFISTKFIGTRCFLNIKQILELHQRGHYIGSHSHTHPSMISKLSDDEIQSEWEKSVKILTDITGGKITIASIPNGYDSRCVVKSSAKAGIKVLYTSAPTTHTRQHDGVVVKGRYVIHSTTVPKDILKIITSKRKRLLMRAKWYVLEVVKIIMGDNYDRVKSALLKIEET